ncbi:MAG TPA: hypothetical protein VFI92_13065 [Steroidobacteraceae bacterium]|nr:hypothetical protein [Steroidobacteraceae bacterium]
MSVKEMAGIVAAVAIAIVAARDVQPADADRNSWLREPLMISEPLPPGHPPIPGSRAPQGHPPLDQAYPRLPEGHPPIPWSHPGCPGQGGMPDESLGAGFGRDEQKIIST